MMEWIDDNHVKGEMSDDDFKKQVDEVAKTRDMKRYGRDGQVQIFEEKFEYRGIPYFIRIARYYQIGVPLAEINGMNHLGKWALLEYDQSVKDKVEVINRLRDYSSFLWEDSLHDWNRDQTLKQMVESMHESARKDIDGVPKMIAEYKQEVNGKIENAEKLWIDFLNAHPIPEPLTVPAAVVEAMNEHQT